MLVLKRYTDQSVRIGDLIKVTVCSINGNKCQLGIEAPDTIEVHREEVYQQIQSSDREVTMCWHAIDAYREFCSHHTADEARRLAIQHVTRLLSQGDLPCRKPDAKPSS